MLPWIAAFAIAIAPLASLAAPSLSYLAPGADCGFGCSAGATLLSPDGTLAVGGKTHDISPIDASGVGVRWTAASGWSQFPSVGSLVTYAGQNYRHIAISADNKLLYNEIPSGGWFPGIALDGAPPGIGIVPQFSLCPNGIDFAANDAISHDGSTVAGTCNCGEYVSPASQDADATLITPLRTSRATSMSDDGQVVVGTAGNFPNVVPWIWSADTGYQELAIPLVAGAPLLISGDASTLVGTSNTANGQEAFVWDAVRGVTYLGDLAGGTFLSTVVDISRDGSLVAGYGFSTAGIEAFAWTAAGGLVGLGLASYAVDMTPSGLIVGPLFDSPDGDDTFVWNPRTGWHRSLESLLRDGGVAVPADGLGDRPIGISDDGRTIAGSTWVATIDEPGLACDVEMSQPTYVDGEAVVIASLRYTNNSQTRTETRLRLQLTLPWGATANAVDAGAAGGLFIPANFSKQLAPVTMFALQPGQPRGSFQWRCAFEDPHTGAVRAEDVAPFEFQ